MGSKFHSVLVTGFSIEKKHPLLTSARTHRAVNNANVTPSNSFCLAFRQFWILCRALLKTVHGVPKWQYKIIPKDIRRKTAFWLVFLSMLKAGPLPTSMSSKQGIPVSVIAFESRAVPENISKKYPPWSVNVSGCLSFPSSVPVERRPASKDETGVWP